MNRIRTAEAANYLDKPPSLKKPLPYELIQYNQKVYAKIEKYNGDIVFVETFITQKFKGKVTCAYIPTDFIFSVYPRTPETRLELLLLGAKIIPYGKLGENSGELYF